MTVPVSYYSQTFNDNTVKGNGEPETASLQLAITTLSAANLVAKSALVDALRTAIDDLIIGVDAKHEIVFSRVITATTPATSDLAQRENKYLVRYHGATTLKKFRASIPTADLTLHMPNSEFVDISTGVGAALKSAWEAIVVSPDDSTEAVVVDSIQFVGRNT